MVSRMNQVTEFDYRPQEGEASTRRRVLVLSETEEAVGGIDLGKLGDEDRDCLQEAAARYRAEVERVFPLAYRRFLRARIGPQTRADRMRDWEPPQQGAEDSSPVEIPYGREPEVHPATAPEEAFGEALPTEAREDIPVYPPPEPPQQEDRRSFTALTGREADYWLCPRCSMKSCYTEEAATALGGGVLHKARAPGEEGRCHGCGFIFQMGHRTMWRRHTTFPTRM